MIWRDISKNFRFWLGALLIVDDRGAQTGTPRSNAKDERSVGGFWRGFAPPAKTENFSKCPSICLVKNDRDFIIYLIVVPYTWSLKYLVPLVDLKSKSMSKTIQNVQKPATNIKKQCKTNENGENGRKSQNG